MATRIQDKTPEERKAIAAKSVATRQANIAKRKAEDAVYEQQAKELRHGIQALKTELESFKKEIQFAKAAKKLTTNALLKESEIVVHAIPVENSCGVYFLVHKKRIVYVGQSTNVFSRIFTHTQSKTFDSYVFMPCEKDMLNKLESLYIHFLMPPLNGNLHNGYKMAPLPLNALLK
jgi:hypothetical protein